MKYPIVFVPGLLCTEALYAPQITVFSAETDCMVADHTRHDSIPAIVEDVLVAAPARFHLIGLSMGGYVALEVADRAPDRIVSLTLMDTTARADSPEQTAFRRQLVALGHAEGIGPVADRLLPWFINKSRLGDAELVATVRKMAADTGVEIFERQQTAIMNRKDARPDLANINCPTLVICGDRDVLTPVELSREIADGIAGAELVIVKDSGHLTTLERPEAVNAALGSFLKSRQTAAP